MPGPIAALTRAAAQARRIVWFVPANKKTARYFNLMAATDLRLRWVRPDVPAYPGSAGFKVRGTSSLKIKLLKPRQPAPRSASLATLQAPT